MPPLAIASVPESVRVPDVVIGPPVNDNPVVPPDALIDVTPPLDPLETDVILPYASTVTLADV